MNLNDEAVRAHENVSPETVQKPMPHLEDEQEMSRVVARTFEERCRRCSSIFPLTTQYWNKDKSRDSGWSNICKTCRAEERRVKEGQEILDKVAQLQSHGIAILGMELEQSNDPCPHVSALYQDVMTIFNGPMGFAKHLYAQYLGTPLGSANRFRILKMITDMARQVSEDGKATMDLDRMTDAELEAELERLAFRRAQQNAKDAKIKDAAS